MSGARNQMFLFQVGRVDLEILVGVRRHLHYDIAIAGGKYRRPNNLGPIEEWGQLPVSVGVSIPVHSAAKARLPELVDEEIQILLSQPRRHRRRNRDAVDEAIRLIEQKWKSIFRKRVAGGGAQNSQHRFSDVLFQFLFDLARFLKIILIEILLLSDHLEENRRAHWRAR